MTTAREYALRAIQELDAARKVSSRERPVDELGIIEAAIVDAMHEAAADAADDALRDERGLS